MTEAQHVFRDVSYDDIDAVRELPDGEVCTFVSCTFVRSVLEQARLPGARFDDCDLSEALFADADLTGTTWVRCRGTRADFTRADLTDATFQLCEMPDVRFHEIVAAGTTWRDCKFFGSTFAKLEGIGWTMSTSVLMYANLHGLSFRDKTVTGLDMTEADLTEADFRGAVLSDCRLIRANWRGASFEGADLRGADIGSIPDLRSIEALRGAIVSGRQAYALARALGVVVDDGDAS